MEEKVIEGHIGKYLAKKATEVITIYDVYRKTLPYGFMHTKDNEIICFNRDYEIIEFNGKMINHITGNDYVCFDDFAEQSGANVFEVEGVKYEGYLWFLYNDGNAPYYNNRGRREYKKAISIFLYYITKENDDIDSFFERIWDIAEESYKLAIDYPDKKNVLVKHLEAMLEDIKQGPINPQEITKYLP